MRLLLFFWFGVIVLRFAHALCNGDVLLEKEELVEVGLGCSVSLFDRNFEEAVPAAERVHLEQLNPLAL